VTRKLSVSLCAFFIAPLQKIPLQVSNTDSTSPSRASHFDDSTVGPLRNAPPGDKIKTDMTLSLVSIEPLVNRPPKPRTRAGSSIDKIHGGMKSSKQDERVRSVQYQTVSGKMSRK
jgi:hypothetical protein